MENTKLHSNINVAVEGAAVGLALTSFNTDGNKEVSFTATSSSIASDAITFKTFYSNIGAIVEVSNISIKRENLSQDDEYAVSNVWFNFTDLPSRNKIFSIQRLNGLSNLETLLLPDIFCY